VDVAVAYNELGNAYKAQGLLTEALESYRLSLRIREAALGPKALDVANSLWNIACCYELQERYGDANAVLVRAVRIYQAELGPDHDETLEATKFAARMGEAKRVAKGGDEPWKSDHKGHPWSRMDSGP
jgi:tetratricopeptide (TPR) repeat protein